MPRRLAGLLCLLAVACGGLAGCSTSGMFGKSPFASEQWEPEVEDTGSNEWKSAPSKLRKGKSKESSEDPLDKLFWSEEARDINRSLGGSL
jgi:hypothetical protein